MRQQNYIKLVLHTLPKGRVTNYSPQLDTETASLATMWAANYGLEATLSPYQNHIRSRIINYGLEANVMQR